MKNTAFLITMFIVLIIGILIGILGLYFLYKGCSGLLDMLMEYNKELGYNVILILVSFICITLSRIFIAAFSDGDSMVS